MADLIVSALVTLDGVMEAPGGEPGHPHTGWAHPYMGDEQIALKYQETLDAEALLIGRVTYESSAGAWPGYEGESADRMNGMPKHVISSTLVNPAWTNTTVIPGDGNIVPAVESLKRQAVKPILVEGSISLVHTLANAGLVDLYRLLIFPVTVGSGRRLFAGSPNKTELELVTSKALANGTVMQEYRPARG